MEDTDIPEIFVDAKQPIRQSKRAMPGEDAGMSSTSHFYVSRGANKGKVKSNSQVRTQANSTMYKNVKDTLKSTAASGSQWEAYQAVNKEMANMKITAKSSAMKYTNRPATKFKVHSIVTATPKLSGAKLSGLATKYENKLFKLEDAVKSNPSDYIASYKTTLLTDAKGKQYWSIKMGIHKRNAYGISGNGNIITTATGKLGLVARSLAYAEAAKSFPGMKVPKKGEHVDPNLKETRRTKLNEIANGVASWVDNYKYNSNGRVGYKITHKNVGGTYFFSTIGDTDIQNAFHNTKVSGF